MAEFRPREVVRLLGVSPATLRSWAISFSEYLTPQAAGGVLTPEGRPTHRSYTDADLMVLRHAQALIAEGCDFAEARKRLGEPWTPADSPGVGLIAGKSDSLTLSLTVRTMQQQFASLASAKDEVIASKDEVILELRGKVVELERQRDAALAAPARRRWFGRA